MLKGATLSKAFRKNSSHSELAGEGEGNICAILLVRLCDLLALLVLIYK